MNYPPGIRTAVSAVCYYCHQHNQRISDLTSVEALTLARRWYPIVGTHKERLFTQLFTSKQASIRKG